MQIEIEDVGWIFLEIVCKTVILILLVCVPLGLW